MTTTLVSTALVGLTTILGEIGVRRLFPGERLTMKSAIGLVLIIAGALLLLV